LLAFAAIHGKFDGVAVGAMEGLVLMEQGLDMILAGLDLIQTAHGITKGIGSDGARGAGFPILDVDAKDELRVEPVGDLEARFDGGIRGEQQQ
jgi:hypothetical protein